MVSLRKRLDNILLEIAVINEALEESSHYPPCCIEIQNDGKYRCDVVGALPEKQFLARCKKCRAHMKKLMSQINPSQA